MNNSTIGSKDFFKSEAIYDGFEFDPNLEIYWDALENSLESTLDIVPPENVLLPPSPEK